MAESSSSSSSDQKETFETPWVEKYRPEFLRDVVGNEEAVTRLAAIAQTGNLPNIILTGPPGIGKTTSVLCLAREMLGEAYRAAVLELNASDARGIDVVRTKIKMFAQKKVTLPPGRHKIVILDEADSMTAAAQQALRRTMEIYSSTTRFAIACNNSTKIIEPIQSRCAILRFARLADAEVLARARIVCAAEGIACETGGLEAAVFVAEGDLRNALNALQAASAGFGRVTADAVFRVCDAPHPAAVRGALEAAAVGRTAESVRVLVGLCSAGYAATDVAQTLFRVARGLDLPEPCKLDMIREIGFTHMRIAEGLATPLQIAGCAARLAALGAKWQQQKS